ncbi:hypothetical protein COU19_02745 [Candidatus Kaiserbacteria bacterium CG10_big_fil_rev_8_21_14_0_10_56_12]|uniref:Uncharacterized protein n=1 Tax=Candidatus Kaiserbacteria bacterium CG10_big_fil_rev_8_21_14_0_10_56_12 TaxID=1974611 RepID=A0A2H0U9G9_9BACT|nr:MAG: hypothetical protein COU19_02745 [Candidatus Kaiserbacteria bacterium CG10_big_fil_rev_8_21_14_0_10_56_12]
MVYSQRPLVRLIQEGQLTGESGKPDHVETVISNVFLFSDKVYKIYKSDNDFFNRNFNDISAKARRFDFTTADFEWNHQLSQEVYTALRGVRIIEKRCAFVDALEEA